MHPLTIFLIPFVGVAAFFRVLYRFRPHHFDEPIMRSMSKLRWHHIHVGIGIVFVTILLSMTESISPTLEFALHGFGMGMIMDEYVLSLFLPTQRKDELDAYEASLNPTIMLFAVLVLIAVLLVSISTATA